MENGRREFLAGLSLAAVAAVPFPVCAQPEKNVFARRGPHGRLNLSYAHIRVGATRPFSVLHLSDTHLTEAYPHEEVFRNGEKDLRTTGFGGLQKEALADSFAWAEKNVDLVVHTGDLVDWQSEANFDFVRRQCGGNMLLCAGNHEFYTYLKGEERSCEEAFKEKSRELLMRSFPVDLRFSSRVVNGVNFVCMDNAFGTFAEDLVARFKAEVQKGLPVVLCIHVPIMTEEIWRVNCRFWDETDRHYSSAALPGPSGELARQRNDRTTRDFIAYLKSERLLKCILAGHVHVTFEERFSETACQYLVGGNFLFCGKEILFS